MSGQESRIGDSCSSFGFRRTLLAACAAVVLTAAGAPESRPAAAAELPRNQMGVTGYFDTTVSAGAAMRTRGRDSGLVGTANGGTAYSINGDDGNLNYGKGDFVSANAKVTHELQLKLNNLGFFGRAFYFYDHAVADTDRTALSNDAKQYAQRDVELLDAYVTGDFDAGGIPVSIRAGNQVISWGESVFLRNGLNSINPADISKLRVAGAEVRDVLEPIPAINVKTRISDKLSLEGFYQFRWAHTEIEPAGTFFSTNDFASPGGNTAHLGFGVPGAADDRDGAADPRCTAPGQTNICSRVPRAGDRDADHQGQFGVALRYFAPELNDTELGLYYARIHSRLPLISVRAGTLSALTASTGYAGSVQYFREFPENIDLMGASFNTEIGASGFALQGEISYRKDQPLQVDDVELLFSALSPLNAAVFGQSQTGPLVSGEELAGFRRKDVVQGQVAVTKALGPMIGANQLVFLGEAGFTHVGNMEDKSVLRFEGPGTRTSANPFFTAAGIQPATQDGGFADPFSWGYRVVARATYNNAIGPVNLSPQIAFAHDVNGTSPSPIGNFVEDRKTITLSLEASYLHSWRARLSYTNSFSGGDFNLRSDRDFVALTASYSF